MTQTEKWLYFLMEGSQVVRFHSRPTLKPITDGQHQHGVAMLCIYLCEGKPSANLLMAALTHDMAEQAASDMSSPAKRALGLGAVLEAYEHVHLTRHGFGHWAELTMEEERTLYIADQFEGMLSCVRERFYGNAYVCLPMRKWIKWMTEYKLADGAELDLYRAIVSLWQLADAGGAPEFDVFQEVDYAQTQGK